MKPAAELSKDEFNEAAKAYYATPIESLFTITTTPLLAIAAGMAILISILTRNKLGILSIFWMSALVTIGNFYRLGIAQLAFTNLGAIAMMFYLPISIIIGATVEEILHQIPAARRQSAIRVAITITVILGILGGYQRVVEKDEYRYFVTEADLIAMNWIRENTPHNAIFAVNTIMWMPTIPHGTDGGYWIPYFTSRQTTAGTMLSGLGPKNYQDQLVRQSLAAERLVTEPDAVEELCGLGVDFVYIGPMGDFSNSGLNPQLLLQDQNADLIYKQKGVYIFKLCVRAAAE